MLAAKSHQNNLAGVEDEILLQANLFLNVSFKTVGNIGLDSQNILDHEEARTWNLPHFVRQLCVSDGEYFFNRFV